MNSLVGSVIFSKAKEKYGLIIAECAWHGRIEYKVMFRGEDEHYYYQLESLQIIATAQTLVNFVSEYEETLNLFIDKYIE